MMRTIWKFKLHDLADDIPQKITVSMPAGANIFNVGIQQKTNICIWAEVDTENQGVTRNFIICPTVAEVPLKGYIGTIQWYGLVLHIYEL
jgi:hypothetical protein